MEKDFDRMAKYYEAQNFGTQESENQSSAANERVNAELQNARDVVARKGQSSTPPVSQEAPASEQQVKPAQQQVFVNPRQYHVAEK